MKKIKIELCVGTNCYILGGSDLLDLENVLPDAYTEYIEIDGSPCLDFCKQVDNKEVPYVRINGNIIIKNATVPKLLEIIDSMMKNN